MDNERDLLTLLYELAKAIRFCHQEEICGEGITFVQFNILNCICDKKTMRLSDLHEVLSVDKSTTTRLVDPLVKKGLVLRIKSLEDSRAVELQLTDDGKQTRNRAWECLQGFIGTLVQGIPEAQRSDVYESVKLFARALQGACGGDKCCQNMTGVIIDAGN